MPGNYLHIERKGFEELIDKAGRMHPDLHANVKKAVEVNARHMKDDAIQFLEPISTPGIGHAWHLKNRISYKMRSGSTYVEARIEPRTGKQAGLGAIIEAGAEYSAPRRFLEATLTANVQDLMDGIDKAIEDAWNR